MCKIPPIVKQFLAIACCNILTLSFGLSSGWATINLLELKHENSTFSTGPLTQQELSNVISLVNVGGFIGNYMMVPLGQMIGFKRMVHFLGIPLILSSILIIWATNVYFLYVSRVLTGLVGGGLAAAIPTLVNDISYDRVRGALNSIYDPFNNSGMIISFLLGNCLSCTNQAKVQLIPPAIFLIILFFLPETPEFWRNRNKTKKANKSHRFYKGSVNALNKPNSAGFHAVAQCEKDENVEKAAKESCHDDDESNSSLCLSDFCTPHAKRASFISFTSLLLSFSSGALLIISFTTYIFKETGSLLSEKDSSILVSITTLVANFMFLNIVERFNRRTLYIASSFLTTASYLLFAVYGYFWHKQPGFEWMPPFCFVCIVYNSWMGLLPIPNIITYESFPKKIRQTCIAIGISIMWCILFVVGTIFFTLIEVFGLYNFMVALAFICLLNGIFAFFFIPETRGRSYEEIKRIMIKSN